jgi:hypothetical protein
MCFLSESIFIKVFVSLVDIREESLSVIEFILTKHDFWLGVEGETHFGMPKGANMT